MAVPLSTAKNVGWVYILFFTIGFLIYGFYAPTASTFENTYERNYKVTDLFYSQRWSPYFFFIGGIVFLCLVPITLAFALDDTKGSTKSGGGLAFRRFIFHIFIVAILMIYFGITTLIFGSIDWSRANRGEAANAYNPANDDKWCCFYYTLETGCFTKQACNAGGNVADLKTNGVFLFQYWFSVAYLIMMVIDVILVALLYLPSFRAAAENDELQEGLLSSSTGHKIKGNVARATGTGRYMGK